MINQRKWLLRTLVLIAAFAVPVATLGYNTQKSERGRYGKGRRGGTEGFYMLEKLDLTEQQREQIAVLRTDGNAEETEKSLHDARRALRDAVENSSLDESSLRQLANKVGEVEGDVAVLRRHIHVRIKEILTPEQVQAMEGLRLEIKAKREEMKKRFEEHRGKQHEGKKYQKKF